MLRKGDDREAVFTDILTEIAEQGRSLSEILRDAGMPNKSTFFEWLDKDESKANRYAQACQIRSQLMFDSIEQDYSEEPKYIDTKYGKKIDTGWVQLQRLKVDAKKWKLAKMNPSKYGDRIDVTSDDKPIQAPPIFTKNPLNEE